MEKLLGVLVAVVCVGAIILWPVEATPPADIVAIARPIVEPSAAMPAGACEAGDLRLTCPTRLAASDIDYILVTYGSPAHSTGASWVDLGAQYGINAEIALAFFVHESSAGSNPAWAGIKPDGTTTHNVGNIVCAGYPTCYGRFRDYPSWQEGIEDWYRLIKVEYMEGRGHATVEDVIPVYAPAIENDVQNYINQVRSLVTEWRVTYGS